MVTVYVKYKIWTEPDHPQLDGSYVEKYRILEVKKLTDLNDMFRHITEVKVLRDENNSSVYIEKNKE